MIYIGVSSCFMYPDPMRTVFGHKTLAYFEQDMARFLSRPGIMPILIPDLPETQLLKFLAEMDGFVFQGGADVASKTYHEEAIENGRWPGDPHRDQYELKIMDYAFKKKRPVLAICRGFQLANVFMGGTLYQDLKLLTKTEVEHRNAELYDKIHHSVTINDQGLLKTIYGQNELLVNSVHHQGVKTLGKDLVVDAISPDDNLIEAFHYKDLSDQYLVGVQWHPEFSHTLSDKVCDPTPLYNHFLNAVKKSEVL
jgi:putative glutamine amidotransferase